MPKKRCSKCKSIKSTEDFWKNRWMSDGYQNYCKPCRKLYHQHDEQYQKKYSNFYHKSAKGKLAKRKYQQSEKHRATRKRYKNSPKGRANVRKHENVRRTRKTQAGGSYTGFEWFTLCKFYEFSCLKCGKVFLFEELTVDHIKPVSKGGTSFIWNLQPLCVSCNTGKGDRKIDYRKSLPDWINRDGLVWQQLNLFR